MANSVAIGILVLGVAFGAYWVGHTSCTTSSAMGATSIGTNPDHSSDILRIETAIAGFDRRLELLEAQQIQSRSQLSAAQVGPALNANASRQQPSEIDEEERRDRQAAQIAEIDKRLTTEPRDRSWSTSTEDQIRQAARAAMGDAGAVTISSLSCRTSICRIQLTVPNTPGPQPAMTMLPFLVKGMAGYQVERTKKDTNGNSATTYSFFRDGYPIPGLDEPRP